MTEIEASTLCVLNAKGRTIGIRGDMLRYQAVCPELPVEP
jgi:hypothetical protein